MLNFVHGVLLDTVIMHAARLYVLSTPLHINCGDRTLIDIHRSF